jgi:hypothetical protein
MTSAFPPSVSAAALHLRAARWFLLLLLAGDALYLAMHLGHLTVPALRAPHYSLETDRGLAEFYQYLKQFWIALCLGASFLQRRHLALLCWAALFAFLLVDDALQIHERAGVWLGGRLGLPALAGLRPDDLGEVLVAGGVAAGLLVGLAATLWRETGSIREVSRELFLLTCALAAFGVVIDALHTIVFFRAPAFEEALAIVEDGGELVVVSAIAAYALRIALQGRQPVEGLRPLLLGAADRGVAP